MSLNLEKPTDRPEVLATPISRMLFLVDKHQKAGDKKEAMKLIRKIYEAHDNKIVD